MGFIRDDAKEGQTFKEQQQHQEDEGLYLCKQAIKRDAFIICISLFSFILFSFLVQIRWKNLKR